MVRLQPFSVEGLQGRIRGSQNDYPGCLCRVRRDFFKISRTDYARHLEDLKYENIRGDQTTSIDAKAILQLIVYGAWNNLEIDEALPIVTGDRPLTISDIFDLSGLVDCFGWLKEFHKIAFERHWERAHEIFRILLGEVRDPLMRKFQAQIDATMNQADEKFKPNLKHLDSYSCVFQINDDYSWLGGGLPLNLGFSPYEQFEIAPARDSSNISFLGGNPGSGKTTLLSSLACLSIRKEKQVVFIPLSDNFNWPTLAFMPQMEIEGHKRDNPAYDFNKGIGIKPEGVPTIILDVVKDMDELLGVPLTKYDRIVKVDAYSAFKLDMDLVLRELKDVSAEFGYSEPAGIIAARYLYRKGTKNK
ncbi:MAG: ATP-binding protein [Rhabdochlamydiaceae bacterium]